MSATEGANETQSLADDSLNAHAARARSVLYGLIVVTSAFTLAFALGGLVIIHSNFSSYTPLLTLLTLAGGFGSVLLYLQHFKYQRTLPSALYATTGVEIASLVVFWGLFLGGSIATIPLRNSRGCEEHVCHALTAVAAAAWTTLALIWIQLLIVIGSVVAVRRKGRNGVWVEELSGRYGHITLS